MPRFYPNVMWLIGELLSAEFESAGGEASLIKFNIFIQHFTKLSFAMDKGLIEEGNFPSDGIRYYYSRTQRVEINCEKRTLAVRMTLGQIEKLFTSNFAQSFPLGMLVDWISEIVHLNKQMQDIKIPDEDWTRGQLSALRALSHIVRYCVIKINTTKAFWPEQRDQIDRPDQPDQLSQPKQLRQPKQLKESILDALLDFVDICLSDVAPFANRCLIGGKVIDFIRYVFGQRHSLAKVLDSAALDSMLIRLKTIYKHGLRNYFSLTDVGVVYPELESLASELYAGDSSSLAFFGKIFHRQSQHELAAIDIISLRGILRHLDMIDEARIWPVLNYYLRSEHPLVMQHTINLVDLCVGTRMLTKKETVSLLNRLYFLTSNKNSRRAYCGSLAWRIVDLLFKMCFACSTPKTEAQIKLLDRVGDILIEMDLDKVDEKYIEAATRAIELQRNPQNTLRIFKHVVRAFCVQIEQWPTQFRVSDLERLDHLIRFIHKAQLTYLASEAPLGEMVPVIDAVLSYGKQNPLGDIDQNFVRVLEISYARHPVVLSISHLHNSWSLACWIFGIIDPLSIHGCCESFAKIIKIKLDHNEPAEADYESFLTGCVSFLKQITIHKSIQLSAAKPEPQSGIKLISAVLDLVETIFQHAPEQRAHLFAIIVRLGHYEDNLWTQDPACFRLSLRALACDPERFLEECQAYKLTSRLKHDLIPYRHLCPLVVPEGTGPRNLFDWFTQRWLGAAELADQPDLLLLEVQAISKLLVWLESARLDAVIWCSMTIINRAIKALNRLDSIDNNRTLNVDIDDGHLVRCRTEAKRVFEEAIAFRRTIFGCRFFRTWNRRVKSSKDKRTLSESRILSSMQKLSYLNRHPDLLLDFLSEHAAEHSCGEPVSGSVDIAGDNLESSRQRLNLGHTSN